MPMDACFFFFNAFFDIGDMQSKPRWRFPVARLVRARLVSHFPAACSVRAGLNSHSRTVLDAGQIDFPFPLNFLSFSKIRYRG